MRTSSKLPATPVPEPAPAEDPWSSWIDLGVSIGNVVLAFELMIVHAAIPAPPRAAPRRRLVLVHSRRDEGKT